MRAWKAVVAVVALAGTGVAVKVGLPRWNSRGVVVDDSAPVPGQSVGLFIGVRKFDQAVEVPFAVDDAVDLAYLFSLDDRVGFIPPTRVALAITGLPQKLESRQRLAELKDAGAEIEKHADQSTILGLLEKQSKRAGTDGAFVISIASHGFAQDGIPYVLGAGSRFEYPETAVQLARIQEAASRAERSVIFVDACRERIALGKRSSTPEPRPDPPLIKKMEPYSGQVLLSAATVGGSAFDDDINKNGVFTKAVLDGLQCGASTKQNTVRVATLHTFVERQVLDWIHKYKDPNLDSATQISTDGRTDLMPLAECPPRPRLIDIEVHASHIKAFDSHAKELWDHDLGAPAVNASTNDLDADGKLEVVAATPKTLITLDHQGNELWRAAADDMPLVQFAIGHRRKGSALKQVVALWSNGRNSRLTAHDPAGRQFESIDGLEAMMQLAIYRPTNTYNPRLVTAGMNNIMLFEKGKEVWRRTLLSSPIRIESVDCGGDKKKDILVTLAKGQRCYSVKGDLLN